MAVESNEFVIVGRTRAGERFRPSDWAERLCGVMAQFGAAGPLRYSPYVYPVIVSGEKCGVVDARGAELEPLAYRFLAGFARDNDLVVRPGMRFVRARDEAGTARA
ncbi:MAG TPA: DUF3579 domain-containing protein [Burkholderiales bacterium]|jgi:hypothetical protein|nr:DUF3579 domain-containing protein [Burkholderiales bacterium]